MCYRDYTLHHDCGRDPTLRDLENYAHKPMLLVYLAAVTMAYAARTVPSQGQRKDNQVTSTYGAASMPLVPKWNYPKWNNGPRMEPPLVISTT